MVMEWLDGVPLLSATLNSEGNGTDSVLSAEPLPPAIARLLAGVY